MSKRHSGSARDRKNDSDNPAVESGIDALGFQNSRLKWIISGLILFHLFAVVLPPLAFQTTNASGRSPLVGNLLRPFEGYAQFMHMDRGYAFFAPDPGPSRLIQAARTAADGSVTEQMYPDRDDQWPRLLYHRHFMLSEYLSQIYWPPGPPVDLFEIDPVEAQRWQQGRGLYEYVRQSMIDHLKTENEGREVAIRRLEHVLMTREDFLAEPIPLDDPRLYNVLVDQPLFSDAIAPAEDTEIIPSPGVQNNAAAAGDDAAGDGKAGDGNVSDGAGVGDDGESN
ncbi:hypothetical protein NHH03_03790 [Stieleria sp. TO1_6]|uniref:hypothetical protein n=1 Tax=Stieleria tagensis TaxID=2956795 RepID=UPI00209BABE8|nr:hypothetical protein [Stieleria tagensis]MCO8120846.1 hypothetical protein [Stieleria tagensis]